MRRRDFITGIGIAATGWPLAAAAQQSAVPVVGFLNGQSFQSFGYLAVAFRQGLNEGGYIEGENIKIEYRWADGQPDRLPALAADLVRLQVAVIAATGGNNAALAAKAATGTIPILFTSGEDPRRHGLVESLSRPGGNITGVSWFSAELGPKRLALLHELVPGARTVALLINPHSAEAIRQPAEMQEAARTMGLEMVVLNARTASDVDTAFGVMAKNRIGALVLAGDPFILNRRDQIVALAAHHSIPAIYGGREYPEVGGLMSYGNNRRNSYRRVGIYAARILKGAKPADLPVDRTVKFELIINLKTAKTLGLDVPMRLLMQLDQGLE
jgi:putative tryptophan/tyrosine transport system substrate-binding protein